MGRSAWVEDTTGAEQAVREYLELVEDGRAEQANRMVPLTQTPVDGNDETAFQVQGFVSVSSDGELKIAYRT
jgi:hypothetical protein